MSDIQNINDSVQLIRKHFSEFLGDGFRLEDSAVDKKAFGNWVVVLRSEQCIIKFIQDRGSISAVIGPPWASAHPFNLEHFLDLRLLIDFSQGNESFVTPSRFDGYDADKNLSDLRRLLGDHFSELVKLLACEDFAKLEEEVRDLNLQRLRKMYPNIM
ncbi:MAG: hypothetical protein K8S20_05100 [Chloroflexi bacterium]|nr:hypothetical protein [Chloroflexota bacterium]